MILYYKIIKIDKQTIRHGESKYWTHPYLAYIFLTQLCVGLKMSVN